MTTGSTYEQDRTEVPLTGAPRAAGVTVWLTGLPSAGKTTIANALATELIDLGRDFEILDGDEVRTHLSKGLGFSRADRDTHVRRIGFVAELLASHGVVVIVPVIAPYAAVRDEIREHHLEQGTQIIQVHLSTAVEVCADRDVKGLYAKAARGEISNMTGVTDPYEIPAEPDLRIDTAAVDLTTSVALLTSLLAERNLL